MNANVTRILQRWRRPIIFAFFALFAVTGLLTRAISHTTKPLFDHNQAYLSQSINDTFHLMLPVGIVKAAADVIEGSTIKFDAGVVVANAGVEIEAGDTLQPILKYIDIAWRLLLVSMVYLVSAKSILLGANAIAHPFFVVSFLAYLMDGVIGVRIQPSNPLRKSIGKLAPLCFLCALIFTIILPLTVYGASYLSRHTTEPLRAEMWTSFEKMGEVFSLEDYYNAEGLKAKATVLKDKTTEIATYAKDAVVDVAGSVAKLAAIKLLNGIVFPLASLIFLIWIIRGCLYPVMGLGTTNIAEDDFQRLSNWISHKKNQKVSNQALEATSESALGADSSAPQG